MYDLKKTHILITYRNDRLQNLVKAVISSSRICSCYFCQNKKYSTAF